MFDPFTKFETLGNTNKAWVEDRNTTSIYRLEEKRLPISIEIHQGYGDKCYLWLFHRSLLEGFGNHAHFIFPETENEYDTYRNFFFWLQEHTDLDKSVCLMIADLFSIEQIILLNKLSLDERFEYLIRLGEMLFDVLNSHYSTVRDSNNKIELNFYSWMKLATITDYATQKEYSNYRLIPIDKKLLDLVLVQIKNKKDFKDIDINFEWEDHKFFCLSTDSTFQFFNRNDIINSEQKILTSGRTTKHDLDFFLDTFFDKRIQSLVRFYFNYNLRLLQLIENKGLYIKNIMRFAENIFTLINNRTVAF